MDTNTNHVAGGFIPTRKDFGWDFFFGLCTLSMAIAAEFYHPPLFAAEMIKIFVGFAMLYVSYRLIEKRVIYFVGAILFVFFLGALSMILLGDTSAIELFK